MPEIKLKFEPKEDITAYELAFLVAHIVPLAPLKDGVIFTHKQWNELPYSIQRHFK